MKLSIDAKLIRFVQPCVAKQDVRYYLEGILFAKNGDIVATDGHTLAKTSHTWDNCDVLEDDIIIQIDGAVPKSALHCHIDTESNTCTCIGKRGKTVKILPTKVIDGRFPDYTRVIPDKVTGMKATEQIAFNPLYLGRAAAFGGKFCTAKFSFFGAHGSCLIEPNGQDWPMDTCMVVMSAKLVD